MLVLRLITGRRCGEELLGWVLAGCVVTVLFTGAADAVVADIVAGTAEADVDAVVAAGIVLVVGQLESKAGGPGKGIAVSMPLIIACI